MKTLMTPFLLLIITTTIYGGTGSISGGSDKFQRGSVITFRRDSTWVNILYNKTVCHDGSDFHAVVRQCTQWERDSDDDRTCVRREKNTIIQPMLDYRIKCIKRSDDECIEWGKAPLNQSPKRLIEIKDDSGNLKSRKKMIIPKCK